ncbi:hypothetical protein ACFV0O_16115 [Kitasatospora sp. NPDC059577]|uniref:hypothetical protein n=1 Tax=Kitasatospora sp. NPDC059577 TaxID=3346873 RepID=UPI003691C892
MAIAEQTVIAERAVITARLVKKHTTDILLKPDLPPSEEDHRRVARRPRLPGGRALIRYRAVSSATQSR